MVIKFIGHATFHITTDSGVRIVTDPYEAGAFGGAIGYGRITDPADVVTVSHEHADHNFVTGVPGSPTILREAGEVEGVRFTVVMAHHDSSGGKERGEDRIFRIAADGIALAHLGDLGHVLTAQQVAALQPLDILFIPVGGTFTLDAQKAWETIDLAKPKIVIPMHFGTVKTEKMPLRPVGDFVKSAGDVPVDEISGSTVEITAEMLAGIERKVIVLQPAA